MAKKNNKANSKGGNNAKPKTPSSNAAETQRQQHADQQEQAQNDGEITIMNNATHAPNDQHDANNDNDGMTAAVAIDNNDALENETTSAAANANDSSNIAEVATDSVVEEVHAPAATAASFSSDTAASKNAEGGDDDNDDKQTLNEEVVESSEVREDAVDETASSEGNDDGDDDAKREGITSDEKDEKDDDTQSQNNDESEQHSSNKGDKDNNDTAVDADDTEEAHPDDDQCNDHRAAAVAEEEEEELDKKDATTADDDAQEANTEEDFFPTDVPFPPLLDVDGEAEAEVGGGEKETVMGGSEEKDGRQEDEEEETEDTGNGLCHADALAAGDESDNEADAEAGGIAIPPPPPAAANSPFSSSSAPQSAAALVIVAALENRRRRGMGGGADVDGGSSGGNDGGDPSADGGSSSAPAAAAGPQKEEEEANGNTDSFLPPPAPAPTPTAGAADAASHPYPSASVMTVGADVGGMRTPSSAPPSRLGGGGNAVVAPQEGRGEADDDDDDDVHGPIDDDDVHGPIDDDDVHGPIDDDDVHGPIDDDEDFSRIRTAEASIAVGAVAAVGAGAAIGAHFAGAGPREHDDSGNNSEIQRIQQESGGHRQEQQDQPQLQQPHPSTTSSSPPPLPPVVVAAPPPPPPPPIDEAAMGRAHQRLAVEKEEERARSDALLTAESAQRVEVMAEHHRLLSDIQRREEEKRAAKAARRAHVRALKKTAMACERDRRAALKAADGAFIRGHLSREEWEMKRFQLINTGAVELPLGAATTSAAAAGGGGPSSSSSALPSPPPPPSSPAAFTQSTIASEHVGPFVKAVALRDSDEREYTYNLAAAVYDDQQEKQDLTSPFIGTFHYNNKNNNNSNEGSSNNYDSGVVGQHHQAYTPTSAEVLKHISTTHHGRFGFIMPSKRPNWFRDTYMNKYDTFGRAESGLSGLSAGDDDDEGSAAGEEGNDGLYFYDDGDDDDDASSSSGSDTCESPKRRNQQQVRAREGGANDSDDDDDKTAALLSKTDDDGDTIAEKSSTSSQQPRKEKRKAQRLSTTKSNRISQTQRQQQYQKKPPPPPSGWKRFKRCFCHPYNWLSRVCVTCCCFGNRLCCFCGCVPLMGEITHGNCRSPMLYASSLALSILWLVALTSQAASLKYDSNSDSNGGGGFLRGGLPSNGTNGGGGNSDGDTLNDDPWYSLPSIGFALMPLFTTVAGSGWFAWLFGAVGSCLCMYVAKAELYSNEDVDWYHTMFSHLTLALAAIILTLTANIGLKLFFRYFKCFLGDCMQSVGGSLDAEDVALERFLYSRRLVNWRPPLSVDQWKSRQQRAELDPSRYNRFSVFKRFINAIVEVPFSSLRIPAKLEWELPPQSPDADTRPIDHIPTAYSVGVSITALLIITSLNLLYLLFDNFEQTIKRFFDKIGNGSDNNNGNGNSTNATVTIVNTSLSHGSGLRVQLLNFVAYTLLGADVNVTVASSSSSSSPYNYPTTSAAAAAVGSSSASVSASNGDASDSDGSFNVSKLIVHYNFVMFGTIAVCALIMALVLYLQFSAVWSNVRNVRKGGCNREPSFNMKLKIEQLTSAGPHRLLDGISTMFFTFCIFIALAGVVSFVLVLLFVLIGIVAPWDITWTVLQWLGSWIGQFIARNLFVMVVQWIFFSRFLMDKFNLRHPRFFSWSAPIIILAQLAVSFVRIVLRFLSSLTSIPMMFVLPFSYTSSPLFAPLMSIIFLHDDANNAVKSTFAAYWIARSQVQKVMFLGENYGMEAKSFVKTVVGAGDSAQLSLFARLRDQFYFREERRNRKKQLVALSQQSQQQQQQQQGGGRGADGNDGGVLPPPPQPPMREGDAEESFVANDLGGYEAPLLSSLGPAPTAGGAAHKETVNNNDDVASNFVPVASPLSSSAYNNNNTLFVSLAAFGSHELYAINKHLIRLWVLYDHFPHRFPTSATPSASLHPHLERTILTEIHAYVSWLCRASPSATTATYRSNGSSQQQQNQNQTQSNGSEKDPTTAAAKINPAIRQIWVAASATRNGRGGRGYGGVSGAYPSNEGGGAGNGEPSAFSSSSPPSSSLWRQKRRYNKSVITAILAFHGLIVESKGYGDMYSVERQHAREEEAMWQRQGGGASNEDKDEEEEDSDFWSSDDEESYVKRNRRALLPHQQEKKKKNHHQYAGHNALSFDGANTFSSRRSYCYLAEVIRSQPSHRQKTFASHSDDNTARNMNGVGTTAATANLPRQEEGMAVRGRVHSRADTDIDVDENGISEHPENSVHLLPTANVVVPLALPPPSPSAASNASGATNNNNNVMLSGSDNHNTNTNNASRAAEIEGAQFRTRQELRRHRLEREKKAAQVASLYEKAVFDLYASLEEQQRLRLTLLAMEERSKKAWLINALEHPEDVLIPLPVYRSGVWLGGEDGGVGAEVDNNNRLAHHANNANSPLSPMALSSYSDVLSGHRSLHLHRPGEVLSSAFLASIRPNHLKTKAFNRAAWRWRLALTLLLYPQLRFQRKHFLRTNSFTPNAPLTFDPTGL